MGNKQQSNPKAMLIQMLQYMLQKIPNMPKDQINDQIIPKIEDPNTEVKEKDIPEFLAKLAENPATGNAILKYLLTKPKHSDDELETFLKLLLSKSLSKHTETEAKENKQKPTSSRR